MPQGRRARAMAKTRRGRRSWGASPTCRGSGCGARRLCPCLQPARDQWSGLVSSRIAIGIRRAVAAFKTHLVRPVRRRPVHEEFGIEGDAAFWIGVELDHPSLDAIGIELWIDGAVQRVGEIDATAVAADLHHLRAAAERAVLGGGVRRLRDDAANADLAGQLWLERI